MVLFRFTMSFVFRFSAKKRPQLGDDQCFTLRPSSSVYATWNVYLSSSSNYKWPLSTMVPRSQIIGRLSHPGLSIQQNNRDTQALLAVAIQRFQQLFYNSTTDHHRSSAGTRAQSWAFHGLQEHRAAGRASVEEPFFFNQLEEPFLERGIYLD